MSGKALKMQIIREDIHKENCACFHAHFSSQSKKKDFKYRKILIENEAEFFYQKKQSTKSSKTRYFTQIQSGASKKGNM